MLEGPRARVGDVVDGLKDLLPERLGDYWPESSGTDVAEDGVSVYVLPTEVQAGAGT